MAGSGLLLRGYGQVRHKAGGRRGASSLTAVEERSSSKITLMVKSRCERLSGSLLTPPRRAGKKLISSPVVPMSPISPPRAPSFPAVADIQQSSRQKGCVLRTPLRNSFTPSPWGVLLTLQVGRSRTSETSLNMSVSCGGAGWA